jgi:hypothetical protein
VFGDRYAGEWPREQFGRFGVGYDPAVPAKSQLYGDLLALINSARIDLLDHLRFAAQLCSLERRHDDLANAVAGVVAINNQYGGYDHSYRGFCDGPSDDPVIARTECARRRFDEEWGNFHQPPAGPPFDVRLDATCPFGKEP